MSTVDHSWLDVLGQTLPLAIGVMLSPLPVIGVVLAAMGDRGRATAPAFALGRMLGLTVAVGVVIAASDLVAAAAGAASLPPLVRLAIGLALLVLGVTKWRPTKDAALPGWMSAIADASPARALGLGVVLSIANPKELALIVAAGVTVGSAAIAPGEEALIGLAFVVVASLTVLVPGLAVLFAAERVRPALEGLRSWLTSHSGAVMGTILILIGALVAGGAISDL